MNHVDGNLADFFLDAATKGIPVGVGRVLASAISRLDFIPRSGDLQYPILTMDEGIFKANLDQMPKYGNENKAVLAPHGKMPMAPALAQRLVASGCWGISVANLQQTLVFLNAGLQNLILANEVGGARSAAQLVILASQFPAVNLYVFVASIASITTFKGSLESVGNLSLLIETGLSGGRNGFRDIQGVEDAVAVIYKMFRPDFIGGIGTYESAALGPDMVASVAAMTLGILPPIMLGFFVYPYIGKSMIRGAVKG